MDAQSAPGGRACVGLGARRQLCTDVRSECRGVLSHAAEEAAGGLARLTSTDAHAQCNACLLAATRGGLAALCTAEGCRRRGQRRGDGHDAPRRQLGPPQPDDAGTITQEQVVATSAVLCKPGLVDSTRGSRGTTTVLSA